MDEVPIRRFLNKRLTGWANLRLKRKSIHRASYVRAITREVARSDVDHIVVTGDLTNLALESEFVAALDILRRDLGPDASRLSIVPGNHDVYTRGSMRSRRFEGFFAPWLTSDLPAMAVDVGGARFPIVKIRGPVAIVSLTTAVPRPPFVAAGELGDAQLEALSRILGHPEVSTRTVVLAMHHPVVQSHSTIKDHMEGLRDGPALLSILRGLPRGLVLHGHLHRRIRRVITTHTGSIDQVGATSASLHHVEPDRMAGFNLYNCDSEGVSRVEAMVYDPQSDRFHSATVPEPSR
jgi:3',5'-cyclic AMP phosphodiesterase CpdA